MVKETNVDIGEKRVQNGEPVRSIYPADNQFHCVIQHIHSVDTRTFRTRIIYDLNGQRHTVDCVQEADVDRKSIEYVNTLIDALAKDLALNMLSKLLNNAMR